VSQLERCDIAPVVLWSVDFSRLPITETLRMAQHCGPTAVIGLVLLSSHMTRRVLPGHLPPPLKTTVAYICLWSDPGEG